MGDKLKDQVAVVTGAGRGIGRAEALALAAEGAKVVVNDFGGASNGIGNSKTPADEVAHEIMKLGGAAVANYDNVATPDGGENIIKTAIDNFRRIDIVVNNAGIMRNNSIFNMSEEEWDAVMKVNLYGTFHVTKPACTIFKQQRSGRIINTSSGSGLGDASIPNYSAAKEGIIGFTRTVAREMGRYGVTCNAIRPVAGTRLSISPEIKAALEKRGMHELYKSLEAATPEMIAPLVLFLCTEAASNVNGYDFEIGGGRIGVYSQPEVHAQIYEAGKVWTLDELLDILPKKVTGTLQNPAPPQPEPEA